MSEHPGPSALSVDRLRARRALVDRLATALDGGDYDAAADLFGAHGTWLGLDSNLARHAYSGEALRAYLRAFPSTCEWFRYRNRHVAMSDDVCIVEWETEAKRLDGGSYRNSGATVFEFDNDGVSISAGRPYFDLPQVASQDGYKERLADISADD
jgi:ketosteroid isomerase-like protein